MTVKLKMKDVLLEHGISLEKFVEEVTVLSDPKVRLDKFEKGEIKYVGLGTLDLACRVTGRPLSDMIEYVPEDSPASADSNLAVRGRLLAEID